MLAARIAENKYMTFAKVVDPIVTPRLVRAHLQSKKFRNVLLKVLQETPKQRYSYGFIIFSEVIVDEFKQQFDGQVVFDIGSLTADRARLEWGWTYT